MASRGVNKVILVGNLGNDPEIRYMPSGGAVANITIATSESWRDKNTGEQREKTEWHRVALFGSQKKLLVSTCAKVLRYTSKVNCRPVSGRTKVVRTASQQKWFRASTV